MMDKASVSGMSGCRGIVQLALFIFFTWSAAGDVFYGNFKEATGDTSIMGVETIGSSTWNTITPASHANLSSVFSTLVDNSGSSSAGYTFSAVASQPFGMNLTGNEKGLNTAAHVDESLVWYHDAVAANPTVAAGNNVDNDYWDTTDTAVGDTFVTYTFGGFAATDEVSLEMVIGRPDATSGEGGRAIGIIVDDVPLSGLFGYNDTDIHSNGENPGYFTTGVLTGKTSYEVKLTITSTAKNWSPTGNAFQLTVIPEPATMGLVVMFGLGTLVLRRLF